MNSISTSAVSSIVSKAQAYLIEQWLTPRNNSVAADRVNVWGEWGM